MPSALSRPAAALPAVPPATAPGPVAARAASPRLAMPGAYAAKEALLRELQSPCLLPLTLDSLPQQEWVRADFFFHPLTGIDDLAVAHLLAPPGHTALLVRGEMGAHQQRISMPQAVRLHVLRGAMLWWQASWGPDPRRTEAGDVLDLAPAEEHGFVVLETVLNYNLITPSLAGM